MKSILKVEGLNVSVEQQPRLIDITFSVAAGTTHLVMGSNGAGKSSLAYTLMGHPSFRFVDGRIEYVGKSIVDKPVDERARSGMFLSFQQPVALPGVTVATFLQETYRALRGTAESLVEIRTRMEQALTFVGLDVSCLDKQMHEDFSGGQKKRLELAQVLLFRPKLVIFDEIDAGLDREGRQLVAAVIAEVKKEVSESSFILISHADDFVQTLAIDCMHIMHEGALKTVASGHEHETLAALQREGYQQVWHELIS